MTLIELVVVIGILVILLSIAIPTLRNGVRERKLREAARELSGFIRRAKARAVEIGRPAGIWIERRDDTAVGAKQGVRVHLCEVPPAFSGSTSSSMVFVDPNGWLTFAGEPAPPNAITPVNISIDRQMILSRVPAGATFKIRFHGRKPFFTAQRILDANGSLYLRVNLGSNPPAYIGKLATAGMTFTAVFPPRRVGGESIEFPGDTVIDLWSSGLGALQNNFAPPAFPSSPNMYDPRPVMVLFTPEGDVETLMFSRLVLNPVPPPTQIVEMAVVPPPGPIHFLIGRINGIVDGVAGIPNFGNVSGNLLDPSTIWVTINHRTGKVTTAENVDTSRNPALPLPQRILAARDLARRGVRMGGK